MSKLSAIKRTRAIGDPALPMGIASAGATALKFAFKPISKIGGSLSKLFKGKKALPAIAGATALPAAAGAVKRSAVKTAAGVAGGAALGMGVERLVASSEECERKKRRRRGLTATEIRGFYRVMALVRKAGYKPKAYKKR